MISNEFLQIGAAKPICAITKNLQERKQILSHVKYILGSLYVLFMAISNNNKLKRLNRLCLLNELEMMILFASQFALEFNLLSSLRTQRLIDLCNCTILINCIYSKHNFKKARDLIEFS